ncbi:MAG: hypothetical protein KGN16_18910 [Burkholderiales bacterium]|nr:hypothetical protein [Burkholderiales bacterium]
MNIHEFGLPNGIPVVFFFGTPQRGDAGAEFDSLASERGIRLICPTRPWYDDQSVHPSFDAVTDPVLEYLKISGITTAFAAGGSGGGPFALHLAINGGDLIVDCTLLASMGLPESYAEHVTSPPSRELLKTFKPRDYDAWQVAFAKWGLPRDLAHGAWGDFLIYFDYLPKIGRGIDKKVYVYQSESDPNAPLASVQEMLSEATAVEWKIDKSACHIALAQDASNTLVGEIFRAIAQRSRHAP